MRPWSARFGQEVRLILKADGRWAEPISADGMLPVSLNTSSLKCGRWCNGKALNFTIPLNESHLGAILWTVVDEISSEEAAPTLSAQSVVMERRGDSLRLGTNQMCSSRTRTLDNSSSRRNSTRSICSIGDSWRVIVLCERSRSLSEAGRR